jgi:DNA adenine methylase
MQVPIDAPPRPACRYYGGKWRDAPWIIQHLPPHDSYNEPCGGGGSVLLRKPAVPLETYNDLDGEAVNYFRVIRDHIEELARLIRYTPWAREEYEACRERDPDADPVERARRFWVLTAMGINGGSSGNHPGMRFTTKSPPKAAGVLNREAIIQNLYHVADRLRTVQMENRDALEVIEVYGMHADSLTYFDPPYLPETREYSDVYHVEADPALHINAAQLLHKSQGFAVVSGYASDLYRELYEEHGWKRVDKESATSMGGKRVESLWLNPATVKALTLPVQGELFNP